MVSIQRSGLFFLAIVVDEVPPLLVIELLDRMCRVFKIYFSALSESVLISNFTTVYMLLEEMLDDGFPMTTEPNALMDMIRPPSMFDRIAKAVSAKSSVNTKLGSGVTSQTPWRRSGVKYAQNEIYFDVTESIDCIVAANGQVVSCTVTGVINANCRLSGMPDLTMSFEKSSIVEDVSFHPCVRYSRWERDHVVSFVPPDGDFELMRCVRRYAASNRRRRPLCFCFVSRRPRSALPRSASTRACAAPAPALSLGAASPISRSCSPPLAPPALVCVTVF
jgi:AP-3 complex subunit mu